MFLADWPKEKPRENLSTSDRRYEEEEEENEEENEEEENEEEENEEEEEDEEDEGVGIETADYV